MAQQDLATFSNFSRQVKCPSSAVLNRAVALLFRAISGGVLCAGLIGSLAFLPIAMAQGAVTRRRVPILPPANGPHHGRVAGVGKPIRLLAIGESSVSGVGVSRSDETVAAVTARALGRLTNRPVVWRALGFSGATAREATAQLVHRIVPEPIDVLVVAFGVNDATSYRSPIGFTKDIVKLVTTVRARVGDAAVVIAGVAPLSSFPALPWPLRTILGWRSKALQAAVDRVPDRLTGVVVERFSTPLGADLFAEDKFHPNSKAHELWGEGIAALALPLVRPK